MQKYRLVMLPVLVVLAICFTSCREKDKDVSTAIPGTLLLEIDWTGAGGFSEWGQSVDGFFAISTKEILQQWKWDQEQPQKIEDIKLRHHTLYFIPLDEKYIACVDEDPDDPYTSWPLFLASLPAEKVIRKWYVPKGWGYQHTGINRNGNIVAVTLPEEIGVLPDYNWKNERLRVGLVNLSTLGEINLVYELSGHGRATITSLVVSDDGRYIAVVGWDNGIAMIDASQKKLLWKGKPENTVSFGYAAFSTDGSTLYSTDAGGGCLFVFEAKTGKVIRQRYATETEESIYGHRISCLALSPDGLWLASGTGPEGKVFLFQSDLLSKPIVLNHGMSTILIVSFSPDSQRLASVAGGKVKVWAVKK